MNKNIKKFIIEQGKRELQRVIFNTLFSKSNKEKVYDIIVEKIASYIKVTTSPENFDKIYTYSLRYLLDINKPLNKLCLFADDDVICPYPRFKEHKFLYKNCVMIIKSINNFNNSIDIRFNNLTIEIFGKKEDRHKIIEEYKQFVSKMKNKEYKNDDYSYINYKKYPVDMNYISIQSRKIETIYSDQINNIINIISGWKNEKDIYIKHCLPFKTGLLLYGEPGTGKTSIAKAIASKFYLNMITVNVASTSVKDLSKLCETIRRDNYNNMKLVLLEEIDLTKSSNKEEKMQELLTLLDGADDISGVIFIATTNYINKVDERIKRPGRFDNVIEITDICEETAIKMCKGFEIDHNKTLSKYEKEYPECNNLYNPSKLQKEILNEYHLQKSELNNLDIIITNNEEDDNKFAKNNDSKINFAHNSPVLYNDANRIPNYDIRNGCKAQVEGNYYSRSSL